MKNYKIQYIPTKHIFLLPKEECDRLILESEHNYVVLDKDYVKPKKEEPKPKSTILDSILESKEKPVTKMNVQELLGYCAKNNIETVPDMKKADILALINGDKE